MEGAQHHCHRVEDTSDPVKYKEVRNIDDLIFRIAFGAFLMKENTLVWLS